jgi:hypothetical protein
MPAALEFTNSFTSPSLPPDLATVPWKHARRVSASPTPNVVALGVVVFNAVMVEGAALTGDDGTTSDASTPATAIHSGRRERDFIDLTSEE